MASTETTHDDLAKRLEELQETDHFDPPEAFVAEAMDTDDSLWKEAEKDPVAWWGEQAKDLHWFSEWDTVLDDSDPPYYTWFDGGTINASYNCLDRHVENGLGDRVAIHWRGEEGEERDITYGWLLDQVQRFANVLKDNGVAVGRRRRDLHADDPRGHRRDARVRPHRRAAQRRLRRLLARVGPRADGDLGGQGARHRRRRAAQGQDRADQARGRRRHGRRRLDREDLRGRVDRRRLRDAGGPRRLVARGDGGREPRVRGRAARCRAPAVHPVLVRLDEQAEGHPAHDRRLPDRRRLDDEARLRPQARDGRVLVRGRRRLDHRALLHRLRPAAQRPDPGHVRGAAGLPVQGPPLEARERPRRHDLLLRADRDPVVHEVGRRAAGQARPLVAAAPGDGRRADQPEGLALVPARSSASGRRRSSTPGGRPRPATS